MFFFSIFQNKRTDQTKRALSSNRCCQDTTLFAREIEQQHNDFSKFDFSIRMNSAYTTHSNHSHHALHRIPFLGVTGYCALVTLVRARVLAKCFR